VDLRKIGWCGVDWIDLAPYRDQWSALENTEIKLQVAKKCWAVLE
jgi:hypothetical protein